MSDLPQIPEVLLSYFGSQPAGVLFRVRDVVADQAAPVAAPLQSWLEEVPESAVLSVCHDERFRFFHGRNPDIAYSARIWLLERALEREVPRARYELLARECGEAGPPPYALPALADVEVDEEQLVPLSAFDFDGSRLTRGGHAFLVLATTPSPNSTYWLLNAIYAAGIASQTRVRLDPLLHGPAASFECMFYKMWMYGRPLDWDRIANLREPEHGRWQPESSDDRATCTEFVWEPRGSEVHFIAEELPPLSSNPLMASRYAHAVFVPAEQEVVHFDGAVRLYGPEELRSRYAQHVRVAGKAGIREKVFRTDAPLSTTALSSIMQAFFVWNQDVATYFSAPLAQT